MNPKDQARKDALQALAAAIEARFTGPTQQPEKKMILSKLIIVDSMCDRLSDREIDGATPPGAA